MKATVWSAAAVVLATCLSGCASLIGNESAPLNYYVLTSSIPKTQPRVSPSRPFIVISPPRLPEYLQQKWLVTRIGSNELALAQNDQWASPLSENMAGVLAEDLSSLLESDRLLVMPAPGGISPSYEINVYVNRFEPQPDDHVIFSCTWSVLSETRALLAIRSVNLRASEPVRDPATIAVSMSQLIGELATEIAATLEPILHFSPPVGEYDHSGQPTKPS